MQIDR